MFATFVITAALSTDTSGWIGAEYTPWRASNELWWNEYDAYRPSVDRELGYLKETYGFTALRVWLHTLLYSHNASALKQNLDDFLALAASHGFGVGLVLFDDCWNKVGANLSAPCVPRKGVHNGCWMTSPQTVERTSIARFEPYVRDIVSSYGRDKRVLWFEVFNEPNRHDTFSLALRAAAYGWAKACKPMQPVAACWDDNNATDLVDHHQYGLPWGRRNPVFSNPSKGGFITEAGSRWYQHRDSGGGGGDAGSVLTLVNWLQLLKVAVHDKPTPPSPPCGSPSLPPCHYTAFDGYLPAGHDVLPAAANWTIAEAQRQCDAHKACAAITYEGGEASCKHKPCKTYLKSVAPEPLGGGTSGWHTLYKYPPSTTPPPFVPGVMMQWEMMVGHSQTRWQLGLGRGHRRAGHPLGRAPFPRWDARQLY